MDYKIQTSLGVRTKGVKTVIVLPFGRQQAPAQCMKSVGTFKMLFTVRDKEPFYSLEGFLTKGEDDEMV